LDNPVFSCHVKEGRTTLFSWPRITPPWYWATACITYSAVSIW